MRADLRTRTKRLVVRSYRPSDYPAWKHAYSSMLPKRNHWDQENRNSGDLLKSKFQRLLRAQAMNRRRDRSYEFGAFLRDGTLVGGSSLMNVTRGISQNAYLGYRIFNRNWGKGYGKEMVRAIIDLAFRVLRLHRLEAAIEPSNSRSISLARSLGFRRERLSKRLLLRHGRWTDQSIFALTTEDAGHRWNGKAGRPTQRF